MPPPTVTPGKAKLFPTPNVSTIVSPHIIDVAAKHAEQTTGRVLFILFSSVW
jgi:hypothetical protein